MSVISSIERAIRARENRIAFSLQSTELLPRTDISLLVQPSICKIEMRSGGNSERLVEQFDDQLQRSGANCIGAPHRDLVRTVLGSLVDNRHYSVLCALFGSIHVYTNEEKGSLPQASVLCVQNSHNLRGKQALILQFALREPPQTMPMRLRENSLGLFPLVPTSRSSLLQRTTQMGRRVLGRFWSNSGATERPHAP